MMPEPLERLFDYFLNPEHSWMFGNDVHRAMTEFSGGAGPIEEDSLEHFTDWFMFDFQYRSGETPLAYALRTTPLTFSKADLAVLTDIATGARFGYFEVTDTSQDQMEFTAVEDGIQYAIIDSIAAPRSAVGDMFLCRIAPVNSMWRVINSSALAIRPSARDREQIRSHPIHDSREAYREIVRSGVELPDLSALDLGNGRALVSGGSKGWSPDENDDCAVCRLMRQTKEEGRTPSRLELTRAFREAPPPSANKKSRNKKPR